MITRLPLRTLRTAFQTRGLHTTPNAAPFNVVLDIDGVLIKVRCRVFLYPAIKNNVPYIFLTNGGGLPESEKAEKLSKQLGIPVNPEHLILSHSPMRALVPTFRDSNVLIVGGTGSDCKHVALHYGLRNVVTPEEIHAVHPSVCPISSCEVRPVPLGTEYLKNVGKPINAVMVFHDSVDWGRDLQLCLDALASKGGALGTVKDSDELQSTKQSVPIYFSNPDVVWSNEYPVPRFGQGSFRLCLEKVYKASADEIRENEY
ncbi:hypothetical protein BGZ65_003356 [Modicella reniformis]|uniref:Cat eye syndrome critical region protein 5 n=1 Tax=Modicella reniformis TaxID=1440133 RepID=A0A9P6SVF0_9FUNG|nr:hypothetical protein BGZ65_003356 [Modicella reniformis]